MADGPSTQQHVIAAVRRVLTAAPAPMTAGAVHRAVLESMPKAHPYHARNALLALWNAGEVAQHDRRGVGRTGWVKVWSLRGESGHVQTPRPARHERPEPPAGQAGPQLRPDFLRDSPVWA